MLVRLPGEMDNHLYPAIVIRSRWLPDRTAAIVSAAVFVDSRARSAQAIGPVVTVEDVEPLNGANLRTGGWCWREDSGGG